MARAAPRTTRWGVTERQPSGIAFTVFAMTAALHAPDPVATPGTAVVESRDGNHDDRPRVPSPPRHEGRRGPPRRDRPSRAPERAHDRDVPRPEEGRGTGGARCGDRRSPRDGDRSVLLRGRR